jgi:hypothetical protein
VAKKKKAKKTASRKPRKKQARKRVTGVQSKPRKRSTGARKRPRPRSVKIGSVTQHIAIARHGLESQLKDQMLRQYNATTKMAKRKIGKKIAELKSKIHKLK